MMTNNEINNYYSSKTDGIDHINVYSDAKTYIGTILSNFYYNPNKLIKTEDGEFKSIETYWYWLGIKDNNETQQFKNKLKNLYGYQAKKYGREIQSMNGGIYKNILKTEIFERKINYAIRNKCLDNIDLFNDNFIKFLTENDIKFIHYYNMFNKAYDRPQQDLGGFWLDTINDFVNQLKEKYQKNNLTINNNNNKYCNPLKQMYIDYKGIKIYFKTSYFYKLRFENFTKGNCLPISICSWDPKWYKGMKYKGLVPKSISDAMNCKKCTKKFGKFDEFNESNYNCPYLQKYIKQLSFYNAKRTLEDVIYKVEKFYLETENKDIISLAKENEYRLNLVFMGYEVPTIKCSERFVLSKWINDNGFNCEEI